MTAPAATILHGPAPERAFGVRAGRNLGAIALANWGAWATCGKRARSGSDAATAVTANAEPTKQPAASAHSGRGEASYRGADGGFAGSIPARGRNGQPAVLRDENRARRSFG